jgi:hypothetical protein
MQNAENFNRTAKQQLPFFPFLLSPQQPNGLELTWQRGVNARAIRPTNYSAVNLKYTLQNC